MNQEPDNDKLQKIEATLYDLCDRHSKWDSEGPGEVVHDLYEELTGHEFIPPVREPIERKLSQEPQHWGIHDSLLRESSAIVSMWYEKKIQESPWTKLLKQEKFPDNMGYEMKMLTQPTLDAQ